MGKPEHDYGPVEAGEVLDIEVMNHIVTGNETDDLLEQVEGSNPGTSIILLSMNDLRYSVARIVRKAGFFMVRGCARRPQFLA
jgi:hypothetical protein